MRDVSGKKWEAFTVWVKENDKMGEEQIYDLSKKVTDLQAALLAKNLETTDQSISELKDMLDALEDLMEEFSAYMRQQSKTYIYWENLMQMIVILLQYIRAERDSNWELHMECVTMMAPMFFIAGHTNYARWTPVYIVDMHEMKYTAPSIYAEFLADHHTVCRAENKFASVWNFG